MFVVMGMILTLFTQPQVQAAEASQSTTLTVSVVPLVRVSGHSWTQLDVNQSVTVADILPLSISNLGDQFVVNWAGTYVYGIRQADDIWQVKCLTHILTWNPAVNNLKMSGTFDYTFFAGTPSESTQTFTGDIFLYSSGDTLYTTWNFVPLGNSK